MTAVSDDKTQSRLPPKRLIALLVLYVAASISGLMANQGVLFCAFTLLMVLALIGKQKAGLMMLRGYTIVQLVLVCCLPIILQMPENVQTGPSRFNLAGLQLDLPDYVVFATLIAICAIQVWVAFDKKVKAYFKPKMSFSII